MGREYYRCALVYIPLPGPRCPLESSPRYVAHPTTLDIPLPRGWPKVVKRRPRRQSQMEQPRHRDPSTVRTEVALRHVGIILLWEWIERRNCRQLSQEQSEVKCPWPSMKPNTK